ncbi:MAG: porin [bacterium]
MERLKTLMFACVTMALVPASASALVVHDEGKVQVDATAFTRYVFEAVNQDDETRIGSNLLTGRLQIVGTVKDVGETGVQYDAANNALLDAWVQVKKNSPVGIRVGRFRTPVGGEWQIGLKNIPTPNRTLINDRVLGRATGLNVFAEFDFGEVDLRADVGLYNPTLTTRAEPGQIMAQRLRLDFKKFYLHGAFAKHVMDDNINAQGNRVFAFDDQIDVAAGYDNGKARVHAEFFNAFDGPGENSFWSAYAFAAYLIGDIQHEVGFEPTLAFDYVDNDTADARTRTRALVNVLWSGRDLVTSVGVTHDKTGDTTILQGFFFVQGAI